MSSTESEGRHSPASIDELYQEFGPELRTFLLGVLKDQHQADEALQATFAKALAHYTQIRSKFPRGWLFQVAYREAMLIRRKQGVESRKLRGLAWLPRDGEASPDARLIGEELAEQIRDSVRSLPEEQRQVVLRRIQQNQTFADIAGELGVPLGTVLTRMRLALRKLQRQLSDFQ